MPRDGLVSVQSVSGVSNSGRCSDPPRCDIKQHIYSARVQLNNNDRSSNPFAFHHYPFPLNRFLSTLLTINHNCYTTIFKQIETFINSRGHRKPIGRRPDDGTKCVDENTRSINIEYDLRTQNGIVSVPTSDYITPIPVYQRVVRIA